MRHLLRFLLAAAVVLVAAAPVQAAPPGLLPLNVTNNSGRAGQVWLYVVGTDTTSGRLGYVNAAGVFTPWPAGSIPPTPAPDVAIAGPAVGATRTLQIPLNLSGRMYMSIGAKLKFFLTPTGLVEPAPWAAGDPNRDILFDWSEFTYNTGGLWLNSSQVDMFAVPHAVAVTNSGGVTKRTGQLGRGGRNAILDALRNHPGDWGKLIHERADGTRLRALAPIKGIENGVFDASYFDSYVSSAWDTYRDRPLTVTPLPNTTFTGRTDANGVMHFTNASGTRVASFRKPPTRDVFGCDGVLFAPNDNVVGPIARTLCAALHRSTLGFLHTQPTTDPAQFYTREITDHYSRIMHAHMVDGKAYGFAFDDVGGFESLVNDGDPRSARITLTPF